MSQPYLLVVVMIKVKIKDQVKVGGKDYVYVKEVWAVCVCVATMLQKTKSTKLRYISNEIIGYIFIYNKCKCNVDCIKLSKMWLFIVNIP